jgi:hypothetical protein
VIKLLILNAINISSNYSYERVHVPVKLPANQLIHNFCNRLCGIFRYSGALFSQAAGRYGGVLRSIPIDLLCDSGKRL